MFALANHIPQHSKEPVTRQIILSLLKGYKRPNDNFNCSYIPKRENNSSLLLEEIVIFLPEFNSTT